MALIDNLIVYYKLDEASGNALDAHNVGPYDLTENGTCGTDTGKINGARTFNGTNTWFSRASNAALETGDIDFSVQAWIYMTTTTGYRPAASKDAGGGNREWNLLMNVDETPDAFQFNVYSGSSSVGSVTSGVSVASVTWFHVVGVHSASANEVRIYVDNTKSTASTTGSPAVAASANFEIGQFVGSLIHSGRIDEVGFWKRALDDAEVAQLYNSGAGLSYDSFGGGGGTKAPPRRRRPYRFFKQGR